MYFEAERGEALGPRFSENERQLVEGKKRKMFSVVDVNALIQVRTRQEMGWIHLGSNGNRYTPFRYQSQAGISFADRYGVIGASYIANTAAVSFRGTEA